MAVYTQHTTLHTEVLCSGVYTGLFISVFIYGLGFWSSVIGKYYNNNITGRKKPGGVFVVIRLVI